MIQVKSRNPLRRLIPNNDFQLETFDSPEIVRAKLQSIMGTKPPLEPLVTLKRVMLRQPPLPKPPFLGAFADDGLSFSMTPLRRRRLWHPYITGTIQKNWGRSEVNVRIRAHPVALYVAFFYALLLGVLIVINYFAATPLTLPFLILLGFVPLLGYLVLLAGFWMEAHPVKAAIEKALD